MRNPPVQSTEFEQHRRYLFSLAYRMLGERAAAEDIVQEAFVRSAQSQVSADSPRAYLTRIVSNLCLDERKSARAQRESYVGPWLPEPLIADDAPRDPLEQEQDLSFAVMLVLERLSPLERAAYLLREVFEFSPDEVADFLERDAAAVRQLVHRAKKHLKHEEHRFNVSRENHQQLLERFVFACSTGNLQALGELLHHEVTLHSDGGGRVKAALKPVHGADHVSRFLLGVLRKGDASHWTHQFEEVNGLAALVSRDGEKIMSVMTVHVVGTQIQEVYIVVNPAKLHRDPVAFHEKKT